MTIPQLFQLVEKYSNSTSGVKGFFGWIFLTVKVGMKLLHDDKVGEEDREQANHEIFVQVKVACKRK